MKFKREPMFKDCKNVTEEKLNEMISGIELKKLVRHGKEYVQKPVRIRAVKLKYGEIMPSWFLDEVMKGTIEVVGDKLELLINTPEGVMKACEGDYIIQGIQGEIYPCKSDIFEKYYEEVTNESNSKI